MPRSCSLYGPLCVHKNSRNVVGLLAATFKDCRLGKILQECRAAVDNVRDYVLIQSETLESHPIAEQIEYNSKPSQRHHFSG